MWMLHFFTLYQCCLLFSSFSCTTLCAECTFSPVSGSFLSSPTILWFLSSQSASLRTFHSHSGHAHPVLLTLLPSLVNTCTTIVRCRYFLIYPVRVLERLPIIPFHNVLVSFRERCARNQLDSPQRVAEFRSDRSETDKGSSNNGMCISDVYAATTLTSTLRMQRVVNCR